MIDFGYLLTVLNVFVNDNDFKEMGGFYIHITHSS